jgi:hypothetical protein
MGASNYEQAHARNAGVRILHEARPGGDPGQRARDGGGLRLHGGHAGRPPRAARGRVPAGGGPGVQGDRSRRWRRCRRAWARPGARSTRRPCPRASGSAATCAPGGQDLTVTATAQGQGRRGGDPPASHGTGGGLTPALREHTDGQSPDELHRHPKPEPLLARLGAADGQGVQRPPRLRGRVGRRVWKTLGLEGPPVVNVNGPRYGVSTARTGACWASTTSSSSPTARWR